MHQRYRDARSLIAMNHPFFATVMFHLDHVEDPNIPTMCTNGKNIRFNPSFVEGLTLDECAGVIIHEICHVIFMHHLRAAELGKATGELSPELWNYATDFAINYQLHGDQVKLPDPHLYDTQFEGMTAEEIYDRLLQGATKLNSEGLIGDVEAPTDGEGNPLSDAELSKMKIDVTSVILQAGQAAQQMGNIPGFARELLDRLTESKADWREVLWQFVSSGQEFGYDWNRPNRRFSMSPFILPSFGAHGLPALNCIIDTSGSVSRDALIQFLSEINAAAEAYSIEDVLIVQCDTQVHSIHQGSVKDGEIRPPITGRGGTDMNPALDELRERRPAPTILFSDMEIPPLQPFPYPMLFCRYGRGGIHPGTGPMIDVT